MPISITQKIREGLGFDDVVDKNSSAYRASVAVGQITVLGLAIATAGAGGVVGLASRGLTALATGSFVVQAVQSAKAGDLKGVIQNMGMIALTAGLGGACGKSSTMLRWSQRAFHGAVAGLAIKDSYGKFTEGDWAGGFMSEAEAGAHVLMMGCFAAGTPIRTPSGHKNIEDFEVGDEILSRNEYDPDGPIEVQRVEERFVRVAEIVELHVGGQVIRTTAEHPFWVKEKGWTAVRLVSAAELIATSEETWIAVQDVLYTDEYATVYNVRVSRCQTYFVGDDKCEHGVWAHNAYDGKSAKRGSTRGPTSGKPFSEQVKAAARAENPSATCVFCKRPGTATQVDHAIPRARRGNARLPNAQMACPHCNQSKGARDFPVNPPPGYTGPWPPT